MSASDSAKYRMERVLRLHEQIDAIKADIREVYAEEKAAGGDKTAMGAAISYIRKREKDGTALNEREAMVDVYLAAYDAPRAHTHTREGQSYADQKGRGDIGAALSAVLGVEVEIVRVDSETGEIIEHASDCAVHNEPAFPAGECDCGASGEIIENQESGPDGTANTLPAERQADESSAPNSDATASEPEATGLAPRATLSHSDATPLRPASEQPEAPNSSPEASGANSEPAALPSSQAGRQLSEAGAPVAAASPSSSDEPPFVGRHIEMPDIPAFLRRDHAGATA